MIEPLIILGALGLLFGFGLFIASRVFFVKVDERVESIETVLPGTNCGACGLAGCSGLAKAIVHGQADVTGCIAGGEDVAHLVADVMGVEAVAVEKKVAILRCQGWNVKDKFDYRGLKTCNAANMVMGGPKECRYGCIGYGDCTIACPFDALHMVHGFPRVDEVKCTSCGRGVEACPKNLFELVSLGSTVHVLCQSLDLGKIVRKVCDNGCIACRKCEKICPFDAIHVENNLAVIDFEKCTSCGKCVGECPMGTIKNFRIERKEKGLWPVKKREMRDES
jgi:Na+-translocating ferredoxin:NAD+ oxidoreductase RNF subunit RnfB